ncbi:MAG: radical SAM protein, partial [Coriobacteriia bacterium]|nr:radical SAM protein [Coriobacteriia bacterium]
MSSVDDTALYVHVPFCVAKCPYCDFSSRTPHDDGEMTSYVDAARAETRVWRDRGLLADVSSLYFGGGTPTLLGDELLRLMAGIREHALLRSGAETTVETNPETTAPALIAQLAEAGVTR